MLKTIGKILSITIVVVTIFISAFLNFFIHRLQISSILTYTAGMISLFAIVCVIIGLGKLHRNMFAKIMISVIIAIYTMLELILLMYRYDRGFSFDFFFLWYNLHDALSTIMAINQYAPILLPLMVLICIIHIAGVFFLINSTATSLLSKKTQTYVLRIVLAVCALYFFIWPSEVNNLFLRSSKSNSKVVQMYQKYFTQSISINKKNHIVRSDSRSDGENIFFFHLESINAELVNTRSTPNLLKIAKEYGVLFPRIQGVSMQTIRAQESILCSVLPSQDQSIARLPSLTAELICLPKILKAQGYKTLFFQNYPDFPFANTDVFMKSIGFDELHSADIMKPGDAKVPWGYLEDVFYQRVFEYLQKRNYKKVFVYLAVDSVNHYPFFTPQIKDRFATMKKELPVNEPSTFRERISDSTYIQDSLFNTMFRRFYLPLYHANSHAMIFGDHSWPIGIHKGNIYNENEAFQENFVTSMVVIPSGSSKNYSIGKIISGLYSQIDYMPTILDMIDTKGYTFAGHSFYPELRINSPGMINPYCLISVQPFSDRYLSMIIYPIKYMYNIHLNTVTSYDLTYDYYEKFGHISPITDKALVLEKKCLDTIFSNTSE